MKVSFSFRILKIDYVQKKCLFSQPQLSFFRFLRSWSVVSVINLYTKFSYMNKSWVYFVNIQWLHISCCISANKTKENEIGAWFTISSFLPQNPSIFCHQKILFFHKHKRNQIIFCLVKFILIKVLARGFAKVQTFLKDKLMCCVS